MHVFMKITFYISGPLVYNLIFIPMRLSCSRIIYRWHHGIMGSPEPNWISQVRPHPDCKSVWLAAVSPCCAPIGLLYPLHCLFTSPNCWGTHFLYLSNPPSGNLLPIIPWQYIALYSGEGDLLQLEDGLLHLQPGVPSLEARPARS